eukprot:Skav207012  [mRNA]  locus=scaffold4890:70806:73106:- [translate_table: standard]
MAVLWRLMLVPLLITSGANPVVNLLQNMKAKVEKEGATQLRQADEALREATAMRRKDQVAFETSETEQKATVAPWTRWAATRGPGPAMQSR